MMAGLFRRTGVSQLEFLDKYYNDLANSKSTTESTTEGDDKNAEEQYEQMELSESEKMSEQIEKQLENTSLQECCGSGFQCTVRAIESEWSPVV